MWNLLIVNLCFYLLQLVLARRHRRNIGRPNIGHAIAGLARDRNPLEVDDMGNNVDELTWARVYSTCTYIQCLLMFTMYYVQIQTDFISSYLHDV